MPAELPKEFFTLQSMLTLTGATGATFVVSNGIQQAFGVNPKWLALLIAQGISQFGTYASGGKGSDYFIATINGFLIFCTAAGATGIAAGQKGLPPTIVRGVTNTANAQPVARRRFLTTWF